VPFGLPTIQVQYQYYVTLDDHNRDPKLFGEKNVFLNKQIYGTSKFVVAGDQPHPVWLSVPKEKFSRCQNPEIPPDGCDISLKPVQTQLKICLLIFCRRLALLTVGRVDVSVAMLPPFH